MWKLHKYCRLYCITQERYRQFLFVSTGYPTYQIFWNMFINEESSFRNNFLQIRDLRFSPSVQKKPTFPIAIIIRRNKKFVLIFLHRLQKVTSTRYFTLSFFFSARWLCLEPLHIYKLKSTYSWIYRSTIVDLNGVICHMKMIKNTWSD